LATLDSKLSLIDASVASIMTQKVRTVQENVPIIECVKIMKQAEIGSIVIVESDAPVGIFTERDLVNRIGEGQDNLKLPVSHVMSKPLTVISPKATIWDAITLMGRLSIRRLPVVGNGKLVGILTERDVLRLLLSQQNTLLESVSEYIPAATREQLKTVVGHLGIERPPAPSRIVEDS
jgi:CBS domain-containing protein